MNPSVYTPGAGAPSQETDNLTNQRFFRTMALAVGLSVLISLPFGSWRVTTGLLLGGLLSLLNYHWLRTSIAAAFSRALPGTRPRLTIARYVLRYFIVGVTVFIFYQLNLISLVATLAGLGSFVIALFVEALRELYFIIIKREEAA